MLWVLATAALGAHVECWGYATYPEALAVPTFADGVHGIATGAAFSCAINATDSTVVCWGNQDWYTPSYPPAVPTSLGAVKQITAGTGHVCAVPESGGVRCWGRNVESQAPTVTSFNVSQVACGDLITCTRHNNDFSVTCYGLGTSPESPDPPASLGAVWDIDVGRSFGCAIESVDRSVVCWGADAPPTAGLPAAVALAAGRDFVCAVAVDDATVHCAGETMVPSSVGTVALLTALDTIVCAVGVDHDELICWFPSTGALYDDPPDTVQFEEFIDVQPAFDHICAMGTLATTSATTSITVTTLDTTSSATSAAPTVSTPRPTIGATPGPSAKLSAGAITAIILTAVLVVTGVGLIAIRPDGSDPDVTVYRRMTPPEYG